MRLKNRSGWRSLPLCLYLLAPSFALGADVGADVDALGSDVASLTSRVSAIALRASPGGAMSGGRDATLRFEDELFTYLLGDYEESATGFFGLVAGGTVTDQALRADAEWYLAESLRQIGNFDSAAAEYEVILTRADHPYKEDAVRRLLEVYAETEQKSLFDALYQKEVLLGGVRPSDAIRYSVARAFWRQGDLAKAKSQLLDILPGSALYLKARYFLGALYTLEGSNDQAMEVFQEVALQTSDIPDDQLVIDLSVLAAGRLFYEREQYAVAADWYSKLRGESPYLSDELYEIVWCYVKLEDWASAQQAVDTFMIRFADDPYAAQLRLVQAHLQHQLLRYDDALVGYDRVIKTYGPVRDQFAVMALSSERPREVFAQIIDAEMKGNVDALGDLPPFAYSMMQKDPDISRALDIYRDLARGESDVSESLAIIAELQSALGGGSALGGYDQLRYDAISAFGAALQQQISLLEIEHRWLASAARGGPDAGLPGLEAKRGALAQRVLALSVGDEQSRNAYEEKLGVLTSERAALLAKVSAMSDEIDALRNAGQPDQALAIEAERTAARHELDAVAAEITATTGTIQVDLSPSAKVAAEVSALRVAYAQTRKSSGLANDPMAARLESLHGQLGNAQATLTEVFPRLGSQEGGEIEKIKARFQAEVANVARQQQDVDALYNEAERVSAATTRAGFGRLEDFFGESVMRADLGVIDVYWSQKVALADQQELVVEEKKRVLDELDQRFELIRQKLNR